MMLGIVVDWKGTAKGDFSKKNLLPQSDLIFDFELNGRNFSSLAPPGGKKTTSYYSNS